MTIVYIKNQPFKIAGATPSIDEQARINAFFAKKAAPVEPETPGILSEIGRGIGRGIDQTQAGLFTAAQGLAEANEGSLFGKSADYYRQAAEEQRRQAATLPGPEGGFFGQEGVYNKARSLAGSLGESLPAMVGGVASTLGGAAAGTALGGPVGTVVGGVAGGVAAAGFYAPQLLNENAERQIEQHGYIKDWGKAVGSTAANAVMESVADRVTLGVAGVLREPVSVLLRGAVKNGLDKSATIAARQVGGAAAVGAISEAGTEVLQAMTTRWQADMALMDESAKAEYLENAVVAGILGGVFGGTFGTAGAVADAKTRAGWRQAVDDAATERDALGQRQAAANAPKEKPPVPDDTAFAGLLEDHSGPTKEVLELEKNKVGLDDKYAPKTKLEPIKEYNPYAPRKLPDPEFNETEYREVIEKLRDEKSISPDKIRTGMKWRHDTKATQKAKAIFDEMRRRNDASPTGSSGQYNRITVPKGIPTRTDSDRSGKPAPQRSYVVKPVDDTKRTPYTVELKEGRSLKEQFSTREQAQDFAIKHGIKNFSVKEDTKGQQYGIYEQYSVTEPDGTQRIVGNKVVNTFGTVEEANKAAREYDPNFSAETNANAQKLAEEQAALQVKQQIDKNLQKFVDSIVGAGRVEVDVQDKIGGEFLKKAGVKDDMVPGPDVAVEGVTIPRKDMPQIISAARKLLDPNLDQDIQLRAIVGGHELVHAIRNLDLLTKAEWKKLIDYGANQKVPGKKYTWAQKEAARHPKQDIDPEEMLAEMFRHYVRDPTAFDRKTGGLIGRVIAFIKKFLRLAGEDGADLMKAIYGGKIAGRKAGAKAYPGNPAFSKVKVDPFYSQAEKFFEGVKQEKASPQQWLGMIRNSNIKPEELAWLDLENWFKAFNNQPIKRGDILDYIRASSLKVRESFAGGPQRPPSDEDKQKYVALTLAVEKEEAKLRQQFTDDVNYSYYVKAAYKPFEERSWFEIMLEDYGLVDGKPEAVAFLKLRDEWTDLHQRLYQPGPAWEQYTQPGGRDYMTIAFHLDKLDPEWSANSHYDIPNVIAFTRLKERTIDDKKTLFIEEIQSDLHQQGARYGYRTPFSAKRQEILYDESREGMTSPERIAAETVAVDYANRNLIPNAPLKSSWEDFVIKRLLRYAAENGFDYLSWHGEPDSVARTEQYHDLQETEEPFVSADPEDWATAIFGKDYTPYKGTAGARMTILRAREKALERGDAKAAHEISHLNQQIAHIADAAHRAERSLGVEFYAAANAELREVLSPETIKYFPFKDSGGKKYHVGTYNVTPIFKRYLEKLPRITKQIGKKYGSIPFLYDPVAVAEPANVSRDNFVQIFDTPDDINSFIAHKDLPDIIQHKLEALVQVAYHRGIDNFTPDNLYDLYEKVGLKPTDLDQYLTQEDWDFLSNDPFDVDRDQHKRDKFDYYGNLKYKRWMMPITEELKEAALYRGFPMFSSVDIADINTSAFKKWFRDSKVISNGKPMVVFHHGSFDEDDEGIPNGAMHFGTKQAAIERAYGKQADDAYEAVTTYQDEQGRWQWDDGAGRTSEEWAYNFGGDVGWEDEEGALRSGRNQVMQEMEEMASYTDYNQIGNMFAAFLRIENPKWVKDQMTNWGPAIEQAKSEGHDGIFYYNQAEDRGSTSYIIFNPEQVKSIRNKGMWSPVDPRVQYSAIKVDPKYSQAAPMGQRVPVSIPSSLLTEVEAKMTYNNVLPALQKLTDKLPPLAKGKIDRFANGTFIALQDRMLSVGDLIDRMRANGGMISNETDTYLRDQLFAGQTDERLQAAHRELYTPIARAVKELKVTDGQRREAMRLNDAARTIIMNYQDYDTAIAEMYLYAQHATERNRVMRERNERLQGERQEQYDHGSGMTDEEAADILAWVQRQDFANKLSNPANPNSVRSLVRKLIDSTNDVRVEGELNPDFRVMQYEDGSPVDIYLDYVPLRSWVDEHMDDDADVREFAKTGKGFRIMGKEDYSALGRRSLGSDLIAHAVLQNEEAIVRAGKNEVGRSFLNLIRTNPDLTADVAKIIEENKIKYVYDRRSGRVKRAVDNTYRFDNSVLTVKEGGKEVHIKIKDPRIAKAMNQRSSLGNNGAGALMKFLLGLNRFLASVRTSYNPEFMFGNFFRDIEAALANMTELDMPGLKKEILGNLLSAGRGIRETERKGTADSEWAKIYKDFRERGGKTAFYGIRDLDNTIDKMNKEMAQDLSGNPAKAKKALMSVLNFVEGYNVVVENTIRVATYKAVRDRLLQSTGDVRDPSNIRRASERAAFIAKNLTVNFNMGGDAKPLINALYLFFNASLQGSMALINPMIRSKKVRRLWAGVLAAGIMQDVLNNLLSPEDDDGIKQYDKIPEYVLEHNIVFMDPFGFSKRGYFQFPLPYLMNGIYNAGRGFAAGARGKYTVGETFNTVGGTLIESLNPFGAANSFLNFVAPTIADPLVDLARNENFANEPIAPPENPFGGDEKASQRYWNNTSPAYVTIADWISRLTGSDGNYLPGAIEWSPNQVEYMFEWALGGLWTFVRRSTDVVGRTTGFYDDMTKDWAVNDIPIARRLYGNVTSKNDLQYYVENRDKVLAVRRELKEARESGDSEHYKNIILAYPEEYRIAAKINAFENARKKISRTINKIRESKLPDAEKQERIRELKERQDELVGKANAFLRGIE